MPGRKNPKMTDDERKREYRMMQKRGYGDTVVGERGADIEASGPAAEVAREREKWASERDMRSRHEL